MSQLKQRIIIASICCLLAACGGGGGGSNGNTSTNTPNDVGGSATSGGLRVEASQQQVTTGSNGVTLTATGVRNAAEVEWRLSPDSAGSLSRSTGGSVQYIPPAAGTPITNNIVTIIVSSGNSNVTVTLTLLTQTTGNTGTDGAVVNTPPAPPSDGSQDPGAPSPASGLYLLAGNDFGAGIVDGPGTSARFDRPNGITRDAQGNLYIADQSNYVIRKITPQGTVSTFAGVPGERGSRDGAGPAARFFLIDDIAVDSAGNLLVADAGNLVIRRITPDGTVSTLAGTAGASGTEDGTGSAARFVGNGMRIAVDAAGNAFVTDGNSVRRITPEGVVTTIAGSPYTVGVQNGPGAQARFVNLNGIAVDAAGNIYVTDGGGARNGGILSDDYYSSSAIRKIATDGTVSTLAGAAGPTDPASTPFGFADGTGSEARFAYPDGLTVDSDGNLYVADRGNHAIRRVTPEGVVTTVAGNAAEAGSTDGSTATALFHSPAGITVDGNGSLYLTDINAHTVRSVIPGGAVSTIAGAAPRSGSADGVRSAALFLKPLGTSRDAAGNLFVADSENATIRRIAGDGTVTTFAGAPGQTGTTDGAGSVARFNGPRDLAVDASGNVFVADYFNRRIRRITPAGEVSTYAGGLPTSTKTDGPAVNFRFEEPYAVIADANGNVYVADRVEGAVLKITPQGALTTLVRNLGYLHDIGVDGAGNLYVIENSSVVRKITPQGAVSTLAGAFFQQGTLDGTGTDARLNWPETLAVDASGNVYVGEARGIRKITPQGVVTTVAGPNVGDASSKLRNIYRPTGLSITGPNTLAFTSGNGVFELRLP